MTSSIPEPSSSGSASGASSAAGFQRGIQAGARYFVELGWSTARAQAWLADSMALAQLPMGSVARAASCSSPSIESDSSRSNALQAQVYRELEMLERQARATVLQQITARLARRAATQGAAGLMLLLPSTVHSRDALVELLQREGRRARSERLHAAIRSLGVELSTVPCEADAPGSIAAALVTAARWLWPCEAADLAEAEVELSFGRVSAARSSMDRLLVATSQPHAGSAHPDLELTDSEAWDHESEDEAALREHCLRILVLVHFVQGDAQAALSLTHTRPLVFDRSASMGAMRAAAEFRMKSIGQEGRERRPASRDEFTAPIDTEERRRIARFLALAHAPAGSATAGDASPAAGVDLSKARNHRSVEGLPW